MRGCLKVLAVIVALLFVITAAFALFTVNLVQVVSDREVIKESLAELDSLVVESVPPLVAQALEQEARRRGLPDIDIDEAVLQEAVATLVPPDWIEEQTETAVDAVYDTLETGEVENAELAIDTGPLLERLQGEPGRQVVAVIVDSLPTCTEAVAPPDLTGGDVSIPSCIPPGVPSEQIVTQVHGAMVQTLAQNPQIEEEVGVLRVPLFGAGESEQNQAFFQAREQLLRLQRTFQLAQNWSWTLWLLPLACLLLIALLAVRSLGEWGHWWGWPMVVTAVSVLFVAVLLPALISFWLRTATATPVVGSLVLPTEQFARNLFDAITDVWLSRVYLQAGLMLALGVLLVIVGFIGGMIRSQGSGQTVKS